MGLVGLLTVEAQLRAVAVVKGQFQHRFAGMLDGTANGLQADIDAYFGDASREFANKSNTVIIDAQNGLNDGLFRWVNNIDDEQYLNELMDGIALVLNVSLTDCPECPEAHLLFSLGHIPANTLSPLYQPVQTFIDCILGQKVDKIEKALTWIQSNAHVSFPIVPDDVLMLDANRTKEMMEPVKQAALGNGTDEGDHQGILQRLTGAYINSLKKERIFYVLLILAYVLLVLIGLVVVAFASSMPLSSRLSRRFRRLKLAPPSPYLEKGTLPHPQEDADAGMHRFCNAAPAENCAPDLPAPIFNLRRHRKQFSSASSNRSSTYDGLISAPLPVDIWQQHTASKSWESLLDERHLAQDQAQKAEKPLSAAQADFKKQPRWVFPSASTFWVSLRPWVGREKYDAKEKRSSLVRPLQQSFAMLLSMPIRRALQWWFVPNSAPAPIMQPVVPLVPHNDQVLHLKSRSRKEGGATSASTQSGHPAWEQALLLGANLTSYQRHRRGRVDENTVFLHSCISNGQEGVRIQCQDRRNGKF
ncbi:hypothetical protein L7F22_037192 [Adiantum nelumboides]|nr:hypothetical protein [Adiantum nelumboides]